MRARAFRKSLLFSGVLSPANGQGAELLLPSRTDFRILRRQLQAAALLSRIENNRWVAGLRSYGFVKTFSASRGVFRKSPLEKRLPLRCKCAGARATIRRPKPQITSSSNLEPN